MLTGPDSCPCGSGSSLRICCLPVISTRAAVTAEQLMRSRYTAYVLQDGDYLKDTWAPEHRPSQLTFNQNQNWLGLKIKGTRSGGQNDDTGIVEFVARYKIDGRGHRLHEISQFRRDNGKWIYVAGELKT